jgi:hydroxymethylbilane synthase
MVRAITHAPTERAVRREREILASLGGGCHEAIGATVLAREYGDVVSVRARLDATGTRETWLLARTGELPPRPAVGAYWPRPDERERARRETLDPPPPAEQGDLWIARADALPDTWHPGPDQIVWAAGSRTWQRLAARGVWVHGSADGLGDAEQPNVSTLADREPAWRRLTHRDSGDPDAVATYVVHRDLPADLESRTHFFWTSGSLFLEALRRHPSVAGRWHASGPGRTGRVIRDTLRSGDRASVWLDYDQWHEHMTS